MVYQLLQFAPMLLACAAAAVIDARSRRIPNWLTLPLMLGGLLVSIAGAGPITVGQAFLGLAVGFGLTFLLFILGALGAGDVKLMAGVGAWIGALAVLKVFVAAAIIGMIIVLVQSAWRGRLSGLLRRSALVTINVMHADVVGVENVLESSRASVSPADAHLPYAVPALIGVLLVVML